MDDEVLNLTLHEVCFAVHPILALQHQRVGHEFWMDSKELCPPRPPNRGRSQDLLDIYVGKRGDAQCVRVERVNGAFSLRAVGCRFQAAGPDLSVLGHRRAPFVLNLAASRCT